MLLSVKLWASTCNFAKSNTLSWVFFSKRIHKKLWFSWKKCDCSCELQIGLILKLHFYFMRVCYCCCCCRINFCFFIYLFFFVDCIFAYFTNFSVAIANKKNRAIPSWSLQQVRVFFQWLPQCCFNWPDTNHFLKSLCNEWDPGLTYLLVTFSCLLFISSLNIPSF